MMNDYDLDRFTEIGGRDTPWIEKYPSLVRYSRGNFSYSYWDSLLTNCSNWLMTGRRPRVNALADKFVKSSSQKGGRKDGSITRLLPDNPKQNNLRNSLDSIMEYRFWVGHNRPIEQMERIPLHIRNILKNKDLTYEQLAIRMVMMPEEDCGMILYGLFIDDPNDFLNIMLYKDLPQTVQQVPLEVLLPLSIMYESSNSLYSVLLELHSHSKAGRDIADFRDKAGNNALNYIYFSNTLFNLSKNIQYGQNESDNYRLLIDYGCNPDATNNMGFSYAQVNQAIKEYLKVE